MDLEQTLVLMELVEMDLVDQLVEQEEDFQEVFLVELTIVTTLLILETVMTSTVTISALATMFLSTAKIPGLLSMLVPTNPSVAESMLWAGQRLAT